MESTRPTWVRMVRPTAGPCTMAMTRSRPPQRGQARTATRYEVIVVDNRSTDHSADLCSPVPGRDAARREQAGFLKALAFASDQKLVAKIRRLIDVATALQAQEHKLFAVLHIDLEAAVRTGRACLKSPLFSLIACNLPFGSA